MTIALSAIACGCCLSRLLLSVSQAQPFLTGASIACLAVTAAGAFVAGRSIRKATALPADVAAGAGLHAEKTSLKKSYWLYTVFALVVGFSGYAEYWYCVIGEQRRDFLLDMGFSRATLAVPHCGVLVFFVLALMLALVEARSIWSVERGRLTRRMKGEDKVGEDKVSE